MIRNSSGALLSCLLVFSLGAGLFATAADPVTRRDAARLQAKLDTITKNGSGKRAVAARTAITESELNSYLRYELGDRIPAGVTDPWVSILGENRVSGRAVVDLGQVAKSRKSGGMLDPWNLVGGSLPLTVNGVLHTKNGVGTFGVESVSISGVPVPSWMLQEIVSYYSKSSSDPQGVSIDKPFALPSGIREIQLDRGQAVVVQ
jgi:hypothetical protein